MVELVRDKAELTVSSALCPVFSAHPREQQGSQRLQSWTARCAWCREA